MPGLIGWWQADICDHLSCQAAVSFFNAIFLTSAHFSMGYGLRQTALIAVTVRMMHAAPSAHRHHAIIPALLIRKPTS